MVLMLAKSPYPPLYVEGRQEMNVSPTWSRQERRRRVRTSLHLPVFFFASEHRVAVETTTQNLCSGGFYCISPVPFPVNEMAACYMKIPIYQPDRTEQVLALKCRVRIVRVELLGEAGYGVGCEIEDYCFLKAVENEQAA
jgi:PilZ domain